MQNKPLNRWFRVGTGVILTVAGAVLAASIGGFNVPDVTRTPAKLDIGTVKNDKSLIVCQGNFTVMGLETANPDDAIPIQGARHALNAQSETEQELEYDLQENIASRSYARDTLPQLAGAQAQKISTDRVKGAVAAACDTPTSDQWIVSGETTVGHSSTLTLSNPGDVPATVTVTVFDEDPNDDVRSEAGILIPPFSQRVLSLNSFGVNKKSLVTRIESAGAPVTATVSLSEIQDLTPLGASTTNSQPEPKTELYFAGVERHIDHVHGTEDDDHEDEVPAVVRVFAPEKNGSVEIIGVTEKGKKVELGSFEYTALHATEHEIAHLPENVHGIILKSSEPIVAGVKTAVLEGKNYDFSWLSPSPPFEAHEEVPLVGIDKAVVTVLNLEDKDTEFTLTPADESKKTSTLKVAAGGFARIKLDGAHTLRAETATAAGFTITDKKSIATYPVLQRVEGVSQLQVFPR